MEHGNSPEVSPILYLVPGVGNSDAVSPFSPSRSHPMTRRSRLGYAAALILAAGCGGPTVYPVKGRLVYPDGTPAREAEGATVVFETTAADGRGFSATGPVDADGHFVMTTDTKGDGVAPGVNKVLISPKQITADVGPTRAVATKYEDFATSGLEVTVERKSNDVTLTVEPYRPKRK